MGNKGSTQTTTTSVPDWENQDFQNLISQSSNQVNKDISSVNYPGVISQFGQGTNNILKNQVNPAQLAGGITGAGSTAWTDPGKASSYMSPYEGTALASQINLDRSSLLNPELAQADRSAAAEGALGGDRDQVMKAQLENNFNNTEANTIAQGENTAYNTGLGAFNSDAARNLAAQESGAQTQLAGANSNVYANFAAGQNNLNQIAASEAPGQQVNSEAGILSALPRQGSQQTDTTPNGGGILGGILSGIVGGGAQLLSAAKPFGFKEGGIMEDADEPKKKAKKRSKK